MLMLSERSVLAVEPDEKVLSKTLTFSEKLLASVGRRLQRLNDVGRKAIGVLVMEAWDLPMDVVSRLGHEESLPRHSWKLNLPSNRKLGNIYPDVLMVGLLSIHWSTNSR